jgi:hypothetical protein
MAESDPNHSFFSAHAAAFGSGACVGCCCLTGCSRDASSFAAFSLISF